VGIGGRREQSSESVGYSGAPFVYAHITNSGMTALGAQRPQVARIVSSTGMPERDETIVGIMSCENMNNKKLASQAGATPFGGWCNQHAHIKCVLRQKNAHCVHTSA
jgi:hypothetical protein